MTVDLPEDLRALYANACDAVAAREQTTLRILREPLAHAVAVVLRRVLAAADDPCAETLERDNAVLDGTRAILSLLDGARAESRAEAIAELRDDKAYWDWMASRPEHAPDNIRHRAAAYLEAKGHQP